MSKMVHVCNIAYCIWFKTLEHYQKNSFTSKIYLIRILQNAADAKTEIYFPLADAKTEIYLPLAKQLLSNS